MSNNQLPKFIESLEGLPIEINRNLRLMRELDSLYMEKKQEMEALQNLYLDSGSTKDRKKEQNLEFIKDLQNSCLDLSQEKMTIADHTEQLVEAYLQRLESEIAKVTQNSNIEVQPFTYMDPINAEARRRNGSRSSHRTKLDTFEPGDTLGAYDQEIYCICKTPSSGQMIFCEGKNCEIKWFHFECVGLTEEPIGNWFCINCSKTRI